MPRLYNGILSIRVLKAKNLLNTDYAINGVSDPYAILTLDGVRVATTKAINDNLNPIWREEFEVELNGRYNNLHIEVFNSNVIRDDSLGVSELNLDKISFEEAKAWFPLTPKSKGGKASGQIKIRFKFKPRTSYDSFRVKDSTFPVRTACRVTLYQDAHVGEEKDPPEFEHVQEWLLNNNCFEDIYRALLNARKFIYITGWSLRPSLSLLRRRPVEGSNLTMGQLLKSKADEGVRVLIHVWDEKLSSNYGLFSFEGLMSTFDEEVRQEFANSNVYVQLSFREGSASGSYVFTHHQKSVICDAQAHNNSKKRRLIAFVGGLDLTKGRWDTPAHHLYKTIEVEHKNDFHIPWGPVAQEVGPREPWHDIHSLVEGEIARDVMVNFEQRWKKQASSRVELLYDIDSDNSFSKKEQFDEEHPEAWHVQLFRSIDSKSATIDGIEHGIQDAYINAIRTAKRFIYMENQYFMGSCKHWNVEKNAGCNNQVPYELASRICHSIAEGKIFTVYIVLPMFPEGVPSDTAIQEMLYWQWNTMEMMYREIGAALQKYGPEKSNPTDYLSFFCLGNRDSTANIVSTPKSPVEINLSKSKRFMIYVHSKLLIADDEYVIVGSANINERSLAGDRDTEICIGAYQPNLGKTKAKDSDGNGSDSDNSGSEYETDATAQSHGYNHPEHGFIGAVKRFRISLWTEHTATFDKKFIEPNTIPTVRLMKQIGEENWRNFASDNGGPMKSHLMKYPICVASDGKMTPLVQKFPDSEAFVKGAPALTMLNMLTT